MALDLKTYVEQSFLAPLLTLPDVTDISYNGKEIYYVTNRYGRAKSEIAPSEEEIEQFLRIKVKDSFLIFNPSLTFLSVRIV